jgi:hypothetical protein
VTVISTGIDGPWSLTFDSSGNLWVANATGTIVEYARAELAKAAPVPVVTLAYGAGGLAFDPSGDLWASNGSTVVEFTRSQLVKSGDPKPLVTVTTAPCSISFDANGDLWQGGDGNALSEWDKAGLTRSGTPVAKVTITSNSLNEPCKPTFDSARDLWAGNYNTGYPGTVVEFSEAELAKSGSPAPRVTLSSAAIDQPGDVAFGRSGDLWVPNAGANTVIGFTRSQLARSGSPPFAFKIAGSATGLNWPWAVATEPLRA